MIMQIKLQRAWSVVGWVTVTRYKWWQRRNSGVSRKPFSGCAERGIVWRRQWKSSEKKKDRCSDVCRSDATGVSLCTMETVALPNIKREPT
jgi:hypothetical protein